MNHNLTVTITEIHIMYQATTGQILSNKPQQKL